MQKRSLNHKIKHLTLYFVGAILLACTSTLSANTLKTSPLVNGPSLCQINTAGGAEIRPELISLDGSLQVRFEKIIADYKNLNKLVRTKLHRLLITTANPSAENQSLQSLYTELLRLRSETTAMVSNIPVSHRSSATGLIEVYFQAAQQLAYVEMLENPHAARMQSIINRYSLALRNRDYEKLYPTGVELTQGLIASIRTSQKNNQNYYLITFSSKIIFEKLMRAAALSPVTKKDDSNYLETARCGLNKLIIGKIALNEALLKENFDFSIGNAEPVCLNTPAAEFIKMDVDNVEMRKEAMLREKVAEQLPNPWAHLSKASKNILQTRDLRSSFISIEMYPELLSDFNNDAKVNEDIVTNEQFTFVQNEFSTLLKNEYENYPSLQNLQHFWLEPKIEKLMQSILMGCNYAFPANINGKNLELRDLMLMLDRAEDTRYSENIIAGLFSLKQNLIQLNNEQTRSLLTNYFLEQKRASIHQSLMLLLSIFNTAMSPQLEEMLLASYNALDSDIDYFIKQNSNTQAYSNFINGITKIISENKQNNKNFQVLMDDFAIEMKDNALKIQKILDEKTPVSELPFDKNALLSAWQSEISNLNSVNWQDFKIVLNEKDFSIQKQAWSNLKSLIIKESARQQMTCQPAPTGWKNKAISLFSKSKTAKAESANFDCYFIQRMAVALGLENPNSPNTKMSEVYAALSTHLSSSDLAALIKKYRRELANTILADFRLLDAPVNENIMTKSIAYLWPNGIAKKIYEILPQMSDLNKVKGILQIAIQASLKTLKKELVITTRARSPKDLSFFIKRTKIINSLFGENDSDLSNLQVATDGAEAFDPQKQILQTIEAPGFVFPNLQRKHKQYQNSLIAKEDAINDGFNEFIDANIDIGMSVFGMQILKSVSGIIPIKIGGAKIQSALTKVFDDTLFSNTVHGHGTLFMGMLGLHLAYSEARSYNFHTELNSINNLSRAETLKAEGAENPLPLIEWQDYINQYKYFVSSINQTRLNEFQDLFWLFGPRYILNKISNFNKTRIEKRFENRNNSALIANPKIRNAYEKKIENEIYGLKRKLDIDLMTLGNPKNLDIFTLKMNYETSLSKANTPRQKERVIKAYTNVIKTFGDKISQLDKYENLQSIYAKALFGKNGSVSQLESFAQEYSTLLKIYGAEL